MKGFTEWAVGTMASSPSGMARAFRLCLPRSVGVPPTAITPCEVLAP
ncbi:MAG: hypothetical protein N2554_00430 [Fimbriimonadales bacterium]|nr:hypothetical protein [Fimbriimonadales bacterium]